MTLTEKDVRRVALAAQNEAPEIVPGPGVPRHYVVVAERKLPARWLFVRVLKEVGGLTGLTQTTTQRAGRVFSKLGFVVGEYR